MKNKTNEISKTQEWIKQKIPNSYNFEGKILEFSPQDHGTQSLFCFCLGGFGSCSTCIGKMILGDFYPTLQEAIEHKDTEQHGSNTKAFPIAQYVKAQANDSVSNG